MLAQQTILPVMPPRQVNRQVCLSVSMSVCLFMKWYDLAKQQQYSTCLVDWLPGRLAGCLTGWLLGWLAAWLAGCLSACLPLITYWLQAVIPQLDVVALSASCITAHDTGR